MRIATNFCIDVIGKWAYYPLNTVEFDQSELNLPYIDLNKGASSPTPNETIKHMQSSQTAPNMLKV